MRPALAVLTALVVLAGCGGQDDPEPVSVEGLVVEITREGGEISEFAVRTGDGEVHELAIAQEVDYGFDLEHLEEHRARRLPVRCTAEERDGRLVALEILDA